MGKAPKKQTRDERELRTLPIYRRDHPELGVSGCQEIYRHGDVGFEVSFDFRGVVGTPYCIIRPIRFLGIEVTSYIQTGPDETLPNKEALQTKLTKDFA